MIIELNQFKKHKMKTISEILWENNIDIISIDNDDFITNLLNSMTRYAEEVLREGSERVLALDDKQSILNIIKELK